MGEVVCGITCSRGARFRHAPAFGGIAREGAALRVGHETSGKPAGSLDGPDCFRNEPGVLVLHALRGVCLNGNGLSDAAIQEAVPRLP